MSSTRTKTFSISDIDDLEKVDSWWAGLLRTGAKEIGNLEWIAKGDLSWTLKVRWSALVDEKLPFNVCMPAYSSFSLEDLKESLTEIEAERSSVLFHLKILKTKVEEWGVIEVTPHNALPAEEPQPNDADEHGFADHLIDPSLTYGAKLDLMEKIMVSEFLWPSYKSMTRGLLMLDARIEEISKEIEDRSDSTYTVVHVDRGMLRRTFIEQVGYDNRWLFALDEELLEEDLLEDDEDSE